MLGHAVAVASLLLFQSAQGATKPSPSPQPVAIVAAIEGNAWTLPKTGSAPPLALYDWLTSDMVVELAKQSRVDLIMIDGRRYALSGGARVKLSSASLTTLQGSVTEEPALPRLTLLAPIAGKAPREAGAVRLRARGIARLNPCQTVLALRDEAVLRFEPVDGASRYEIQVRTSSDREVLSRTIDSPPLAIPPGVLEAGADYVWTVRGVGTVPPAKSDGRFHTLDGSVEAARRELATALDPAAIGVLGGIDFHLGLLNEAVDELTMAARRAPGDNAAEAAAHRARAALATACQ